MTTKLKVFTWSDGFHAFTVAASSRPKALEAWGATQDLFKTGLAHEVDEGADRDAALASPGAVISRGLSVDVGQATTRKAKPKDERARLKIKAIEAELEALEADQETEQKALEARQADLDHEREALNANHETTREALVAKLKAARAIAR